jgi:hypothetical protein
MFYFPDNKKFNHIYPKAFNFFLSKLFTNLYASFLALGNPAKRVSIYFLQVKLIGKVR